MGTYIGGCRFARRRACIAVEVSLLFQRGDPQWQQQWYLWKIHLKLVFFFKAGLLHHTVLIINVLFFEFDHANSLEHFVYARSWWRGWWFFGVMNYGRVFFAHSFSTFMYLCISYVHAWICMHIWIWIWTDILLFDHSCHVLTETSAGAALGPEKFSCHGLWPVCDHGSFGPPQHTTAMAPQACFLLKNYHHLLPRRTLYLQTSQSDLFWPSNHPFWATWCVVAYPCYWS